MKDTVMVQTGWGPVFGDGVGNPQKTQFYAELPNPMTKIVSTVCCTGMMFDAMDANGTSMDGPSKHKRSTRDAIIDAINERRSMSVAELTLHLGRPCALIDSSIRLACGNPFLPKIYVRTFRKNFETAGRDTPVFAFGSEPDTEPLASVPVEKQLRCKRKLRLHPSGVG